MARKLIKTISNSTKYGLLTAKVYRDVEWDEYQVEHIQNGILNTAATYLYRDKADALGHAEIWVTTGG